MKGARSDFKAQPTLRYDTQCIVLDPFLAGIFVVGVGQAYPYDSKVPIWNSTLNGMTSPSLQF